MLNDDERFRSRTADVLQTHRLSDATPSADVRSKHQRMVRVKVLIKNQVHRL